MGRVIWRDFLWRWFLKRLRIKLSEGMGILGKLWEKGILIRGNSKYKSLRVLIEKFEEWREDYGGWSGIGWGEWEELGLEGEVMINYVVFF